MKKEILLGSQGLVLAFVLISSGAMAQEVDAFRTSQVGTGETSVSSQIEAQRETPAVTGDNDPTANVIALSRAATQRQDDLREASERFILAQIEAAEKLNSERVANAALLRSAESRRIDDLGELRADMQSRIAEAEAKRIDAIRAVDVNAVQVQSERAAEQATVLAQQVQQSAETLRALVATTATTVATAQEQLSNALSGRIAALEQAQYVGQGRQTLSDPAFAELLQEVKSLRATQNFSTGEGTGSSNTVAWIIAGLGAVLTLISIVGALIAIFVRRPQHIVANGNGNGKKASA